MEYRQSRPEDLPHLETISRLCFGEEPEYRGLLFGNRFTPSQCLVAAQGTLPVGMVFVFPFTLTMGADTVTGGYVYALGVHPDRRGRGVGAGLMSFVWEEMEARGIPLVALVPAERSLFDYYKKLGYHPFANLARGRVESHQLDQPPMSLELTDAETYGSVRERLLMDTPHISWDGEALAYHRSFSDLSGGGMYLLGKGLGCAVVEAYDRTLFVKELLVPPNWLPSAAAALAKVYPGWRMEVRTRPDWGEALSLPVEEFAVARWAQDAQMKSAYLALVLD